MRLLIIDTAGKNGTLGIVERDAQGVRVLTSEALTGGQYSSELIPKFAAMLERLGLQKTEMDGIAVVAGPGSFTGLRVGLAAAKGLAEILQKPLTALSALEAVAAGSERNEPVLVAALDAGRHEVFLAECELHPELEVRTRTELLVKEAELGERLREIGKLLVTPDEKIMAMASEAKLPHERVAVPGPGLLGALGFAQLDRGVTTRPDDLDANYIRRSDAEIFSAPFL